MHDAGAVVELWGLCSLLRSWNDPHKDIERKIAVAPDLFLVGEADDRIVATAMGGYDGHRGSVYYLAVHPDHREGGLGREIMRELEQRLTRIGCPKINIMVREGNEDVIKFYGRIGYRHDPVVVLGNRLIKD